MFPFKNLRSYSFVDKHLGKHKMVKVKDGKEKLMQMEDATLDRLEMVVLLFIATVIRGTQGKFRELLKL